MKHTLGVCYYPEHWPVEQWTEDAKQMAELGLTWVRIGEFAWSRLEPTPNQFEWAWLDKAIATLADAGLKIILCTPTATPPRWMLDKHPDMLAVDKNGQPRKFGSRRHYCFSHTAYRQESVRIAKRMAARYGAHPAIQAWQIDNEYGCHDTTLSYSTAARQAFIAWLEDKYHNIAALNSAWGNVFWSMEYNHFSQIDLPNLTVTEPNPAHVLDFRRFSSAQVVAYNRAQSEAIRAHTNAPLLHNYMGRIVDFDHYQVGQDLDIASWDSYPLGFLADRAGANPQHQQRFARQGDPDFQAFHHDLYRAVGKGRWWVMEQQPGPVNWAPSNPAPLDGMVRLWTWEAIAHQAEAVCYFRWRQAPFAQEQMHAGLLRPDSQPAECYAQIQQVANELADFDNRQTATRTRVALLFDYESCWAWQTQPQAEQFDYFALVFDHYRALRKLGLNVDILAPNTQRCGDYDLVLIPALFTWNDALQTQIAHHTGAVLIGPRAGSRTESFAIPAQLPPAINHLDCQVAYVETLAQGTQRPLTQGGYAHTWLEKLDTKVHTNAQVIETLEDGSAALINQGTSHYLSAWLDPTALHRVLKRLCTQLNIQTQDMPQGIRQRTHGTHRFIFNYNAQAVEFDGQSIPAAGVVW